MSRYHLIYVPGLGKARPPVQTFLAKTWRLWGVESELFVTDWSGKETWEQKLARLLAKIDDLANQGKVVGLVAASAGAPAAVNAYAARIDKVAGVILIAGMINRPEDIGEKYRRQNPAFVDAAYDGKKILAVMSNDELKRILSLYGLFDEIVQSKYSKLARAHNRRLPCVGHVPTIAAGMLFGAPFFIAFLRHRAAELPPPQKAAS